VTHRTRAPNYPQTTVMLLVACLASAAFMGPAMRSPASRHAVASVTPLGGRPLMMADEEEESGSGGMVKSAVIIGGAAAVYFSPPVQNAIAAIASNEILQAAGKKALGGGISGLVAGVIQVLALMWMRTTMNYQYRYGSTTKEALSKLYEEGGIGRFYQGVQFALIQTPLSRFGDTAANTGVLALMASFTATSGLPIGVRTACASAAGSLWRIFLTPVDTLKTTLQVEGKKGYDQVIDKVKKNGFPVLYYGALANAVASFVGSYPWFFTFNLLNELIPFAPQGALALKLCRSAFLGVVST